MLTDIFKNPQILNKEMHKELKISAYKEYGFAKDAYIVPIGLSEMLVAMKSLLIAFIKEGENRFIPIVILGTKDTSNLLLTKDGKWKDAKYIPAAIRCYPFGIGQNDNNRFILADLDADVLNQKDGNLLFNEDLEFSQYGKHAIDFVRDVYQDIENSLPVTSSMVELGILKQAQITIEKDSKKYDIENIFVIDENALNKLESRKLKKLATQGYMKFIYAQLFSMNNQY